MKKYKYFLILFLILLFSTIACTMSKNPPPITVPLTPTSTTIVPLTCTPTSTQIVSVTVNVEIGLNLREDSTENSKSLYILKSGDTVTVIGILENGWTCVEFTDTDGNFYSGYVKSKYLSQEAVPLTATPEN